MLPPEKLFHVVDADASQAKVIEEVRTGRNLVVQGPPGTGKSQTITNIIAAAAKEGRTVLLVAEKMAALSVVHERLVKVGLRDLMLELHSRTASKKAVAAEFRRTLDAGAAVPGVPGAPDALRVARDRLSAIDAALHAPIGDTGETAFSVLGRQARFLGAGAPPPTLAADGLAAMSRDDEDRAAALLDEHAALIEQAGPPDRHPFAGVGAVQLQPVALRRIRDELERARAAALALRAALDAPMSAAALPGVRAITAIAPVQDLLQGIVGFDPCWAELARRMIACADPARLAQALEAARVWRAGRNAAEPIFTDAAFNASVDQLRAPLVAGTSSWFARWGGAYRSASHTLGGLMGGPLPRAADERLALLDQLLGVQASRRAWSDDESFMAAALGEAWRGERTDWDRAAAVAGWCARARSSGLPVSGERLVVLAEDASALARMTADLRAAAGGVGAIEAVLTELRLAPARFGGPLENAELAAVAEALDAMARGMQRYGEWATLCRVREKLATAELDELAARIASGAMTADAAKTELRFARAERLWAVALGLQPLLETLGESDRHALSAEFARLERQGSGKTSRRSAPRTSISCPEASRARCGSCAGKRASGRRTCRSESCSRPRRRRSSGSSRCC